MSEEKKERAPIHLSSADIERAFKKVEEFQKLVKKGKTPQQIFEELTRLVEVDE
ncbi:MAG: hypothetical protein BAJALOKI3v1_130034 [Promethearchaeota archaeon]|jgi:hypothetical protein|nr:MAG: hypothetical protein BAJALOKI3v1_130034 [Candidatus Lokiarchaeota archaeon]